MLYLAVALILLGLMFMGLYFYLGRVERPIEPQPEFSPPKKEFFEGRENSFGESQAVPKEGLQKFPEKQSKKKKAAKQNGVSLKKKNKQSRIPISERIQPSGFVSNDFTASAKALSQRQGYKNRASEWKEDGKEKLLHKKRKKKKKALELTGFFYLDHSRKYLSFLQQTESISASYFDSFKRMGEGRLYIHSDSFEIECGEANWKYRIQNLDQMLFQKSGFVLVARDNTRPLAVFLTHESHKLRDFVKKHSR